MTILSACPTEIELWPAIMGEEPSVSVVQHLSDCPDCRRHLKDREREVSDLRAAARECGVTEAPHSRSGPALEESAAPEAGASQWIGKYRVIAPLGEGGQSVVFRAWHPYLQCEVALKQMKSDAADMTAWRQLHAEARWMADLRHPHIARVLDCDIDQGRPFLVMELIPGPTLVESAERLNWREAVKVAADVASAVAALHEHDVLHLDLKPENVLLNERGESKLIDFGLSRPATPAAHTEFAPIAGGTPEYMAPELYGDGEAATAAADVFGIGAILFFLLTRRPPNRTPRPQGEETKSPVRPFSAIDFGPLDERKIPGSLRRLCHQLLSADPRQRPQSAAELRILLLRELRTSHWRRAAALAFVLGGFFSFAGATWSPSRSSPPLRVWVERMHSLQRPEEDPLSAFHADDRVRIFGTAPAESGSFFLLRLPSGRVLHLQPPAVLRRGTREYMQFPKQDPAVIRDGRGLYVAMLCTPQIDRNCDSQLLSELQRLPAPPNVACDHVVNLGSDDPGDAAASLSPEIQEWRRGLFAHLQGCLEHSACVMFRVE